MHFKKHTPSRDPLSFFSFLASTIKERSGALMKLQKGRAQLAAVDRVAEGEGNVGTEGSGAGAESTLHRNPICSFCQNLMERNL